MKKRNAWISGLCALIEPGLGLAYNGKFILAIHVTLVSWGIQTALLFLGVFRSFYLVLAVLTATLAFRISMVAVCVNQARQLAVVSLSRYNRWYIYGLFLATSFIFGSALEQSKASLPHRTFYDPTNSMEPAVREGDYLVADMRFYGSHPLLPGDVVIFRPPIDTTTVCVKRCVAINGHKVQIRDGILYVNDERFLPSLRTKRLSPNILAQVRQSKRKNVDSVRKRAKRCKSLHYNLSFISSLVGGLRLSFWSRMARCCSGFETQRSLISVPVRV